MDIRLFRSDDLEGVAELIARLNRRPDNHIVYLGDDPDEIRDAFTNDLTDLPAEKAVLVAVEGDAIAGVWGLEIDGERGRAYMWGPFVEHKDWEQVAEQLHAGLAEIAPPGTNWFQIAVGAENRRVQEFAVRLGYKPRDRRHYTMNLPRASFSRAAADGVIELTEAAQPAFAALHDKLFPETYYDGAELIQRLDETRRGWVTEDLRGYVYVECKPDLGWASLEFIGVDPAGRDKGHGRALLSRACEWLLSHPLVEAVDLSVASDNPAVGLYRKAGFMIKKEICVFQLEA